MSFEFWTMLKTARLALTNCFSFSFLWNSREAGSRSERRWWSRETSIYERGGLDFAVSSGKDWPIVVRERRRTVDVAIDIMPGIFHRSAWRMVQPRSFRASSFPYESSSSAVQSRIEEFSVLDHPSAGTASEAPFCKDQKSGHNVARAESHRVSTNQLPDQWPWNWAETVEISWCLRCGHV